MNSISELMFRRDMALMQEYDQIPPDDRMIKERWANIVKRDCCDPSNKWRFYFFLDNRLLAVLHSLDLRAAVGIWRVEDDCDFHDEFYANEPWITVYGIRDGEIAFKKRICLKTFGFLMSKFYKSNITDYGENLKYGFTMHHYKNAVPSWIAEATI